MSSKPDVERHLSVIMSHINFGNHYGDVIMGAIAFQFTSLTIVYSKVYSDVDERKHQSSASLAHGLCVGNSPGTGEFPAQMASNAENVSVWWRHHVICDIRFIITIVITVNTSDVGDMVVGNSLWPNFMVSTETLVNLWNCYLVSMPYCKTTVILLLTHWRYCRLAPSYRYTVCPMPCAHCCVVFCFGVVISWAPGIYV